MSKNLLCRSCNAGQLEEVEAGQDLAVKGIDLYVEGLRHWQCSVCGAQIETAEQIDHNASLIRQAFVQERSLSKESHGLLSGNDIRAIRKKLNLTQKEASKLFGGGPTAFTKYESEEVIQSIAMDRLLRVASAVPAAFLWLANHAKGNVVANNAAELTIEAFFDGNLAPASVAAPEIDEYRGIDAAKYQVSASIDVANDEAYKQQSDDIDVVA